jgi:hypothetical protein
VKGSSRKWRFVKIYGGDADRIRVGMTLYDPPSWLSTDFVTFCDVYVRGWESADDPFVDWIREVRGGD